MEQLKTHLQHVQEELIREREQVQKQPCVWPKEGKKGASKEVMKLLLGCLAKSVDSCCKCAKK